jgi:hypothetical protein
VFPLSSHNSITSSASLHGKIISGTLSLSIIKDPSLCVRLYQITMGNLTEEDPKVGDVAHVEKLSTSSLDARSEHVEDLDSIEQTQSGRYAWLVAITAGVGGLLFGSCSLENS